MDRLRIGTSKGSIITSWGATHRNKDGNLISRQASIGPPEMLCTSLSCLWRYLINSLTFVLVLSYHTERTIYAEANRNKKIPERYRIGEPAPDTIWGAIKEILKLKVRR